MSGAFLVRFRQQPVRFRHLAGKAVAELVERAQASIFPSEADAWHAAYRHELRPDHVAVVALNSKEESTC